MSYQPQQQAPAPVEPDRGNITGFAAIKYTAPVIIVLAILAFPWSGRSGSGSSDELKTRDEAGLVLEPGLRQSSRL